LDIWDLIYSLMGCIHRCVFNIVDDCVRIHAGCGEYNGKRFLMVGDKGAGKTTLMTRLLFEGMHIEGDELVLIRDGKTVPFPRRFHIKKSSLNLLPQIRAITDTLPYIKKDDEPELYSFAPSNAGFGWKIENKKTDFIFYLEPARGRKTRVEKCPKYMMVQKAMPLTFFSNTHDHEKIGKLCNIIVNAVCYILHIGDLDSAVYAMHGNLNTI